MVSLLITHMKFRKTDAKDKKKTILISVKKQSTL